jgi:hypothetical protein
VEDNSAIVILFERMLPLIAKISVELRALYAQKRPKHVEVLASDVKSQNLVIPLDQMLRIYS